MPTIAWDRVSAVYGELIKSMSAKEFPYEARDRFYELISPPWIIPGSKNHALFLFVLCFYLRGTIKSNAVAAAIGALYKHRPAIFSPEFTAKSGQARIRKALVSIRTLKWRADDISFYWQSNLQKFHDHWDGNPITIISLAKSYDDLCRMMIYKESRLPKRDEKSRFGFHGFGKKMVSMYLHLLHSTGFDIGVFSENGAYPVPSDFHALRVMIATGCVSTDADIVKNGDLNEVRDLVRAASIWYSRESGVDTATLSVALWTLSKEVCVLRPGNKDGANSHPREHRGKCLDCPVRNYCDEGDISAGPYYERGQVKIERRKD